MNGRLVTSIISLVAGIGVGAAAAIVVSSDEAPDASAAYSSGESAIGEQLRGELDRTDPDQLKLIVDSLIQILDEEIRERRLLNEQIEELRSEVETLRRNTGVGPRQASRSEMMERRRQSQEEAQRSREERLAAAGITPEQLQAIERREAEAMMRQIEFDDRARREGWVNTPRYFAEAESYTNRDQSVREELGDELYDRYLFASGRPNRLVVSSVIAASPAENAGLQPGDVIVSYANEVVFSQQQLVGLRSGGQSGEAVSLNIVREGRAMQITMPRGPMGVQTVPTVVDPAKTAGN